MTTVIHIFWWYLLKVSLWNTEAVHSLPVLFFFSDSGDKEVASTTLGNQIQSKLWLFTKCTNAKRLLHTHRGTTFSLAVCYLWKHSLHTHTNTHTVDPTDFSLQCICTCHAVAKFSWDRAKRLTNNSLLIGSGSVFILVRTEIISHWPWNRCALQRCHMSKLHELSRFKQEKDEPSQKSCHNSAQRGTTYKALEVSAFRSIHFHSTNT